ncbi:MAG: putative membrane-bound metal-dependent hydrolase (DUF457) [halophilic archaeon J07HX64]|nr:MAG: putative membrane-bound metal-dependent hydrolase (DUF457) [halophilic archaeon J07HX64]
MPNYPTHARWGRIGAVLTALVVGAGLFAGFDSPPLAVGGALGAAVATFVGAVFPDIDHHRSIPRRKAVRWLRVLVVAGVASLVALNFESLVGFADTAVASTLDDPVVPSEILVGGGTALVALASASSVEPTLDLVTGKHRGWTHNPLVMFVLTAVLAGGVALLTAELPVDQRTAAVTVVATFFTGCLVHIGLDGELRS